MSNPLCFARNTDAFADHSTCGLPRFQDDSVDRNLRLVKQLEVFAAKKAVPASQIALASILAKGEDIVPIPGTKRRSCLESNAAAGRPFA